MAYEMLFLIFKKEELKLSFQYFGVFLWGIFVKELGEYLKEVRESNGVSIEEASDDLEIDSFLLENLEEGNVRAFRDVLGMKDKIKAYAKYLGLDPEEIADEFNDFLFEHTSKISLSDILAVEKEKNKGKEETVKKMSSPYTIVKQKKLNVKPILYVVLGFFLFIMLILLIFNILRPKEEIRTNELLGLGREGELCELAY